MHRIMTESDGGEEGHFHLWLKMVKSKMAFSAKVKSVGGGLFQVSQVGRKELVCGEGSGGACRKEEK